MIAAEIATTKTAGSDRFPADANTPAAIRLVSPGTGAPADSTRISPNRTAYPRLAGTWYSEMASNSEMSEPPRLMVARPRSDPDCRRRRAAAEPGAHGESRPESSRGDADPRADRRALDGRRARGDRRGAGDVPRVLPGAAASRRPRGAGGAHGGRLGRVVRREGRRDLAAVPVVVLAAPVAVAPAPAGADRAAVAAAAAMHVPHVRPAAVVHAALVGVA